MAIFKNVDGLKFGMLTIIRRRPDLTKGFSTVVECLCDCGIVTYPLLGNVRRALTTSCGCVHKQTVTKHGFSYIPEYSIWKSMIRRCYNKNDDNYPYYGGRGIRLSNEWLLNFEIFYKDMGPRPEPAFDYSIERIDNDLGYSKENCRWATQKEQANNRRSNLHYNYQGKTLNLSDWCNELGLRHKTIYYRISKGMSFEDAIVKK